MLRRLELAIRGHAQRVDGADERTNGQLWVDDTGAVSFYPYGQEPAHPDMQGDRKLNGLAAGPPAGEHPDYATAPQLTPEQEAEEVEPTLGPKTADDDAARLRALEHADDQGAGETG